MLLGFSILGGLWLLLGFIYSAYFGSFAIANILRQYYTGYHEATTRIGWRVAILGIVERCLYSSSWIAGVPEFVAIWLALKVAAQWDSWRADWQAAAGKGADEEHKRDAARATYTGYLLGNALCIAHGVGGLVLASTLASAGLIDEYRFYYVPILLGSGKAAFSHIQNRVTLKPVENRTFSSGTVLIICVPASL